MPRPNRVRARETTRAGNAQPQSEVAEKTLDEPIELEEAFQSGPVEDGDFIRDVAKRAGWNEDKERDGKPIKDWQDERTYLQNLPERVKAREDRLTERLRRTDQVIEAAAEDARQNALKEAKANLAGAVRDGNEEAAQEAAQRVARNSGPHPSTVAWMARNTWFAVNGRKGDDEATAVAITAIHRAESVGAKTEEALRAGEEAVRKRFPEHFPASHTEERRSEPRLADRAPPVVAGGSRTPVAKPKTERGWGDIPSGDRQQMQQFVKRAERKGQTAQQAQSFLATAYWKEKA